MSFSQKNFGQKSFGFFLAAALTGLFLFMQAPAAICAEPLLYDDFEDGVLDTSLWNVSTGSGAIEEADGLLTSQGEPNHKRIDSFTAFAPAEDPVFASARIKLDGDYQKFGFRVNPGASESGLYFDTLEGENRDTVYALIREVSAGGEVIATLTVPVALTWGEFHVLTVEWSPTEVAFHVDGAEKARMQKSFSSPLPVGIWNDRQTTMQTDWVKVESTTPDSALSVSIDIKPGSDPNSINPQSRGVIPVALLSSETFDAAEVDPETVEFGANDTTTHAVHYALEDINEDGLEDYIFHFITGLTGIDCESETAVLTGQTGAGEIRGEDTVRPVGCNSRRQQNTETGQNQETARTGPENRPGLDDQPPAFEDHPVHDTRPGKDNRPSQNRPTD